MSLISETVPNLINGVSQQPAALRLSSQAELMTNCFPSVVLGLGKRPPTSNITKLFSGTLADAFMHTINRDSTERYIVIITDGVLKVFDAITGAAQTVNFGAHVETSLRAVTSTTIGAQATVAIAGATGHINFTTTGTFVATISYESSALGNFTDTVLLGTRTGPHDTDFSITNGHAVRARVSAYTSGSITTTMGWNDTSYITGAAPSDDIRAVTVNDHTFIVNAGKTVAMFDAEVSVSPSSTAGALVFVKQISFNVQYDIEINGVNVATYTAGASGAILTTTAASNLLADLNTSLPSGWTFALEANTISIIKDDGTSFEIKVIDSQGDTHLLIAKDTVQKFTDLPTTAPTGFIVEVIGDNTSNFDNYFVKFVPNNEDAAFDKGQWFETVKPGIAWEIDPKTMPHILRRNSDGTFTFLSQSWGKRNVGDLDSAPTPSFVDQTIEDVFFFKNRFAVLSDENVILTEHGKFFNFFKTSVVAFLDTDPIDVGSNHTKVSLLKFAVAFNKKLLLFSDLTQFVLTGGDILTQETVSIDVTTEYPSTLKARPIGVGRTVFFPVKKGDSWSGMREYQVLLGTETNAEDAADITAHVPKFLPSGVYKLATAVNENMLAALTTGSPTAMHPYKYFWSGESKLQSAWLTWTFNDTTLLNVDFIDSKMFIIFQRSDGVYLESMDISEGLVDPDMEHINTSSQYLTHLDRRIDDTQLTSATYDAVTDQTTLTLPYDLNTGATYQVITRAYDEANNVPGEILQGLQTSGDDQLLLDGDQTAVKFWVGETYEQRFQFSTLNIKEKTRAGAEAVIKAGRLQLKTMKLAYAGTGYFNVEVKHQHIDDPSVYEATGNVLGVSADLDTPTIADGDFLFPILSKNDEVTIDLVNDTHLPARWISAEWEAFFHARSVKRRG